MLSEQRSPKDPTMTKTPRQRGLSLNKTSTDNTQMSVVALALFRLAQALRCCIGTQQQHSRLILGVTGR